MSKKQLRVCRVTSHPAESGYESPQSREAVCFEALIPKRHEWCQGFPMTPVLKRATNQSLFPGGVIYVARQVRGFVWQNLEKRWTRRGSSRTAFAGFESRKSRAAQRSASQSARQVVQKASPRPNHFDQSQAFR